MANFHVVVEGKPREVRRLKVDELIVLSDLAYEKERQSIIADKGAIHNIDDALATLREHKGDPFTLWRYVKTIAGSRQVLDQIGLLDAMDSLSREQTLEIVGQACGFNITIRPDSEEIDARPTQANGNG